MTPAPSNNPSPMSPLFGPTCTMRPLARPPSNSSAAYLLHFLSHGRNKAGSGVRGGQGAGRRWPQRASWRKRWAHMRPTAPPALHGLKRPDRCLAVPCAHQCLPLRFHSVITCCRQPGEQHADGPSQAGRCGPARRDLSMPAAPRSQSPRGRGVWCHQGEAGGLAGTFGVSPAQLRSPGNPPGDRRAVRLLSTAQQRPGQPQ